MKIFYNETYLNFLSSNYVKVSVHVSKYFEFYILKFPKMKKSPCISFGQKVIL